MLKNMVGSTTFGHACATGKGGSYMTVNFAILLLSLVTFASCGIKDTEYGSIAFSVEVEDSSGKPSADGSGIREAIDCTATGIANMSADVKNSGGTSVATGGPWDCSAGSGTISSVPVGSSMSVALTGKDSSGTAIYYGVRTDITVTTGQTTDAGTITIIPVEIDLNSFDNYLTYNGHTYATTIDTMSFESAQALAEENGGYIATINDQSENDFLMQNYYTYLFGFNDIAEEGTWVWVNGEAVTYTNWNTFEPNDTIGYENCVEFNSNTGLWNDAPCNDSGFIVEWGDTVVTDTADTWTTVTSMPTQRQKLTSSAVSGKIYVIGGENYTGSLDTVEEYDPATDTWTTKTSMPTSRRNLTSAAVNGKIYVFGGYQWEGTVLNTVEEYEPATDTWTTKTPMPTGRSDLTAAVVNGKIYVIGGYDGMNASSRIEEYDPATDTWSNKTPMPIIRNSLTSATVNGKIYVIGGENHTGILNTVEEYDPAADTWSTKTSMFTSKLELASAVVNNKIYTVGGYDGIVVGSIVEEYDPVADTWTTMTEMTIARRSLTASVVSGKLYAIGGSDGFVNFDIVEVYTPPQPANPDSWTTVTSMPTARQKLTSSAVSGKIYVIGGYNDSGYLDTVEEYDPATDTWTTKTSMPTRRGWIASAAVNGKIYVFSGTNGGSRHLDTVEEYDPATDTWTTKTSMPTARSGASSAVVNGKIYVIGGCCDSSAVEEYDPATDTWTTKTSMPTARDVASSAVVNGKIYVIAGWISGPLSTNEEYDPANDTWSVKTPMPTARADPTSAEVNGKIYIFGGTDSLGSFFDAVYEYDPANDTFTTKTSMLTARYELTSAVVNGKIYTIGGYDDTGYSDAVEVYTPPRARRKVPDTGQTTSYTDTFGEDSDYSINPPSYTDNGDETITDNVTTLVWQKEDDNTTRTWDTAGTYCTDLTLAGYSDWRLPDEMELMTIVNYDLYSPAINTTYFPNTNSSYYWSSTPYLWISPLAWAVNFTIGDAGGSNHGISNYVRCVRGDEASTADFTDNGDGTVTDNVTTLIWQKEDDDTTRTWEEAITYCEGLSLAGSSYWRLPNIKELRSIVDNSTYNPTIDTTYFPNTNSSEYWSSTTYTNDTSLAWRDYFGAGDVGANDKTLNYYVRCVR